MIENELVARVLLAFDLREPSSCHQTYKLFDELHAAIFGRPEVDADRIVLANDIYNIVVSRLGSMKNELFGKYSLTRYLVIYFVREALETDQLGKELCVNPSKFLKGKGSRGRVAKAIEKIATAIVKLLDTEATRRSKNGAEFFDYKSDLKSPTKVEEIKAMIISQFQIVIDNGYAPSFSSAWGQTTKSKAGKRKRTKESGNQSIIA